MLTILDEINKFLNYLNINTKYLNRIYTIISIVPIYLAIKMIVSIFKTNLALTNIGYIIILVVVIYFWILNFLYYFMEKNTIFDITQLMAKKLPDEVFNVASTLKNTNISNIDSSELKIEYIPRHGIELKKNIKYFLDSGIIKGNNGEGFLIPINTLYPYYYVEKDNDPDYYKVLIGTNLDNLSIIGRVYTGGQKISTLGLYITGGPFKQNNIQYNKVYGLKLLVNKIEIQETRMSRKKHA
jgi:hypothetical protein